MMWLLAVALPLQGSVAATLRVCGPGHERMAVVMAHVAHDHASHHHDDAPAFSHDEASSATQDLHKNAQHTCSACAACCVTAALPADTLRFEAAIGAAGPPPAFLPSPAAFLTDGPDRPPRSLLA
ncbi:hypothetical protein HHL10_18280 [Azohydromonas sp. G-1-1-14]|uniref:Uncharacterized protein n=2 Tax=Azohydromonas caseinilytica TaxID=2728836 RepID=A0A848FC84_9BURK|nr:hypothetical protein [Azohydromonas caseinilytica]